jgi:hypothetical protein
MSAPAKVHWTGFLLHACEKLMSENIAYVDCRHCLRHHKLKQKKLERRYSPFVSRKNLKTKIDGYAKLTVERNDCKYVAFLNGFLAKWDKSKAHNINNLHIATFESLKNANKYFAEDEKVFFVKRADVKKNGIVKYLLPIL